MNDIEIKEDIVRSIRNRALFEEKNNQRKPQSQQLNTPTMITRLVQMVKNELKGEKEKLS